MKNLRNRKKEELSFDLIRSDALLPGKEGKAVVQVTQTKENGYRFSMTYEVSFTVGLGRLELAGIAHGNFDFGDVLKTSRNKIFQRKESLLQRLWSVITVILPSGAFMRR